MSKWIKLLCAAVASFAVLFISVGYAAVTGTMTVAGTATYTAPPEVYIVSATAMDANGTGISYSRTMLASTSAFSGGSSVVYEIRVANTTGVDYGYLMTTAISDDALGAGNALVNYEVFTDAACTGKLARGTVLPPSDSDGDGVMDQYMTFYLKITPKDTATATATTYLNFKFVTPVSDIPSADADIGALAANHTLDRFGEILNDAQLYTTMVGQMNDVTAAKENKRDSWLFDLIGIASTDFMAYVPDTIDMMSTVQRSDAKVCLDLFGGEVLKLSINGVEREVFFMIYRDNVDGDATTGNNGDEYILYMTTDTLLDQESGWFSAAYATVYAGVFTTYTETAADGTGTTKWVQLGDLLTGQAPICDYTDGLLPNFGAYSGNGSFYATDWTSSANYYGVSSGNSVKTVMQAKATSTSACMAQLKTQLDMAREILEYERTVDGITFTAEDLYTEESLDYLKTVYGWDGDGTSVSGLSDIYEAIMVGDNTSYSQAMVVTSTRRLNEALVNLKAK